MGKHSIIIQNLTFSYDQLSEPLLTDFSIHFDTGWTGIIGANGVGKSTILKLATGDLKASQGIVNIPESTVYCPQRTDDVPPGFCDFMEAVEKEAFVLRGRLHIDDSWLYRWETLSHGERKRAQIGTAMWLKPQVLAIDEPTNHLDTKARDILMSALRSFHGVGLLVSHDRELMDMLCKNCLVVDPPVVQMRKGKASDIVKQLKAENDIQQKQHEQANREVKKLKREMSNRRVEASKADAKRSKRGINSKDHDAKAKIDLARMSGKDGTAGKLMNQMKGRLQQSQEKLNDIAIKKTYETGIWQRGEKSKRNALFDLPAGELQLNEDKILRFPKLSMKPDDRIALTGLNGTGKSSFLTHIINQLNLPKDRVTYIPQEISITQSRQILNDIDHLTSEQLGFMMTVVNRLGTRPPRLLESTEPSPGEIRKILLAMGVVHVPHLIIMDEPTNHLDLLSIESLETALQGCPSGLLLISHDMVFLKKLTRIQWHISQDPNDKNVNTLNISNKFLESEE